ncbi:senescence-specific cysteine protease SAG39 [Prunus persica]|uniref:senescence-specific cysteine protease SAG39 n=1 Tax=Prunus persica TaxID=3760 RepID=UPI0009AB5D53|nr:senescence-specific cysteine protease SAG39 [Prunus persica]
MALLTTNQGQSICLAFFLVLILAFCSSQASCSRQLYGEDKIMLQRFEEWMAKHGRVYKDAQEKELRYDIFKSNVEFIEAFKKNKDQRKYTLSINKFADRKNEELRAMRNGYNVRQHLSKKASNSMKGSRNTFFKYENVTEVPPFCDWTTNAVTPVKEQGYDCEQEFIDCSTSLDEDGCHGGFLEKAFEYMIPRNKSLVTEDDYLAIDEPVCLADFYNAPTRSITITGYEQVPQNNESSTGLSSWENGITALVRFDPVYSFGILWISDYIFLWEPYKLQTFALINCDSFNPSLAKGIVRDCLINWQISVVSPV